MAVHIDIGTLLVEADKAPEGWSSPRRFAFTLAVEHGASVLDCGSPLPLFPVAGQTVPMLIETAIFGCTGGAVTREKSAVMAEQALSVLEQIPDD